VVGNHGLVLRNALILVVAQALTTPLAILVNFVMGRYLGPADFGRLYLASTYCSFGFLFVEWGQGGTLPAAIARDRPRSGQLLGTALLWRGSIAILVTSAIVVGASLVKRDEVSPALIALVALGYTIGTFTNGCLDTVRGFERTDISAYNSVGAGLLNAVVVVTTLVLGGRVMALCTVQAACGALMLSLVWRALGMVGVGRLSIDRRTLRELLAGGVPFLFFGLVMALQPSVDAVFMSRMVPVEVIGWHAAAKRLIGVLVIPASALITALYPTLSRLHAEDFEGYKKTAASGIRATTLLAVPLALGCWMYPDIGIAIFGKGAFGPAEDNVRALSFFLFLLYFSMPLGIALLAAGRQRIWSIVQALCIVFSAVLDPLLIPYFQRTQGNGGIGVCLASVVSETFMVGIGLALTPKGIFDRRLARQLALAMVAGLAMLAVGRALARVTSFSWGTAPIALAAYFALLWGIGGVGEEERAIFRGILARKARASK
jgi:O-antigen/teichoic acid export membrane protein